MSAMNRRDFIKASAAASALVAIGSWAEAATPDPAGLKWTKSVCRYCGTGCGLYVGAKDGKVVAVKGDADNHNAGLLCIKGFVLPQIMGAADRLKYPLIRRGDAFVQASWEEAMSLIAARFKGAIEQHGPDSVGFYGSGQGLTEETYAANKLFKAGIRTNNVDGNPRLCMASAVAGYVSTYTRTSRWAATRTSTTPT